MLMAATTAMEGAWEWRENFKIHPRDMADVLYLKFIFRVGGWRATANAMLIVACPSGAFISDSRRSASAGTAKARRSYGREARRTGVGRKRLGGTRTRGTKHRRVSERRSGTPRSCACWTTNLPYWQICDKFNRNRSGALRYQLLQSVPGDA